MTLICGIDMPINHRPNKKSMFVLEPVYQLQIFIAVVVSLQVASTSAISNVLRKEQYQ